MIIKLCTGGCQKHHLLFFCYFVRYYSSKLQNLGESFSVNIHFIVQMIGQLSLTVLKRPLTGSSLSLNGVSMYNEVGVVVDDGLLVVVVVGSLC